MKNKINTIVTHRRNSSEGTEFMNNQYASVRSGFNEVVIIPPVPAINPAPLFQKLALNIQLLECVNSREEHEYLRQEVLTLYCAWLCSQLNSYSQENGI